TRGMLQLEGQARDGRERVLDFLRRSTAAKVQVEEERRPTTRLFRVGGPELPFALALLDDRAFLARSLKGGSKGPQHRKALDRLPLRNIQTVHTAPGLRTSLQEVFPDACAVFGGAVPREWRAPLTEALALRVCPRSFVLCLKKEGDGVALNLRLNVARLGE